MLHNLHQLVVNADYWETADWSQVDHEGWRKKHMLRFLSGGNGMQLRRAVPPSYPVATNWTHLLLFRPNKQLVF